MKYFTKEWFHMREGSNTYELLKTAKEAETYNEGYYQALYNDRLQEHLNTYLEMSKLTVDDVFPLEAWGSISTIDPDGNFVDVTSMVSTDELEKIREGIRREELKARERFVPIGPARIIRNIITGSIRCFRRSCRRTMDFMIAVCPVMNNRVPK